jgi:hypothetical protein
MQSPALRMSDLIRQLEALRLCIGRERTWWLSRDAHRQYGEIFADTGNDITCAMDALLDAERTLAYAEERMMAHDRRNAEHV